jgi:hypothetical protein
MIERLRGAMISCSGTQIKEKKLGACPIARVWTGILLDDQSRG